MLTGFVRKYCFPVILLLPLLFTACSTAPVPPLPPANPVTANRTVPANVTAYFTYRVVNRFPHARDAFTEGLVFTDGQLYEGTGLNGKSSLRRVALETGRVLEQRDLPDKYFGEGVAVYGDYIVQLTWKSHTGFVYDRHGSELTGEFSYATEGWGITHDGERLIMSDGTSTLYFLDPQTFRTTGHIDVSDNLKPVKRLNELEYINGRIYANVWQTDKIAIIDPEDGRVTGWIDLSGILPPEDRGGTDVLNGIAYDAGQDRLFVTGKLWPWLFEIKLVEK
ncbi:MAG: glutaminyl-peptide cyclotransferase [Chloroflexota bacterium]